MSSRPWLCFVLIVSFGYCSFAQAQMGDQPTKHHELLKKDVGSWTGTMKMYPDPNGDPAEAKATETNKMFGKLWLSSEFKADFGGMVFEGRGIFGYDIHQKKYVGTWVDTFSSYMSVMEGTYDEKSKTTTMTFNGIDSETGEPAKFKNTSKYLEDGSRVFTMYKVADSADVKLFEIHYQSKK